MSTTILLQPSYFGPLVQYASVVQADQLCFEVFDNFQKQTYRNRCYIYGANGKLSLNIPVESQKGNRQLTKDVKIANVDLWYQIHFKSLQAAYRCSPYFEFFEDDIAPIFNGKHIYLKDIHNMSHAFVMDALQINKPTTFSTEYFQKPSLQTDARKLINPKEEINIDFKNYVQMFDDKYGFIQNLSILDLLFMEGPNAKNYLQQIDLTNVL